MTDTAAARAYPPEPDEDALGPAAGAGSPARGADPFPPAAHTHGLGGSRQPAVSASSTAVLESLPPLGFPGEPSGTSFGGRPTASEPPPFGFNAPPGERRGTPVSDPAERDAAGGRTGGFDPGPSGAGRAGSLAPAARGGWSSDRPAALEPAAFPRRTLPPRELMPSVEPVRRNRLGETPTPTFGPPGRERSTAAMVFLSILTLGFYAIAWHRRVNQEMGDFDPRVHVHPARSAWAVALPLLAGLLASAAAAAIVGLDHAGVALVIPVTARQATFGLLAIAAVPYLVLLLPFSVVAVAMTAERVRVVEDHAGLTTDEQIRPAALVGWLLVPVVGGFVVMARQQQSLNRIWRLARA